MKIRGFTLVELLAVIVILAIIALIAVPVFLGIINNTKKSSDKEGVNLYTDTVEKAIQKKQMSDPNFMPDKCTIKTDGNLECFSGTTSLGTLKVTMKGTKPTSGTILIEEDDITYQNIVLNGKKYYEVESFATLVTDAAPTGLSIGDKYTYKVNATDTFNFYVLSIDGDKVSLIMDRNICEDGTAATGQNACKVTWNTSANNNNYGPDTAITNLYNGTKNWSNVPDMIMNYTDENNTENNEIGYTSIITSNGVTTITGKNNATNTRIGTNLLPLKARLPKESEATEAGCTDDAGSCPVWLVENLYYASNFSSWCGACATEYASNNGNGITNIYGYWLLPSALDVIGQARSVSNAGNFYSGDVNNDGRGVRPVITVSKSDL